MSKLKMSNLKFRLILVPIAAFLITFLIVFNIVAVMFTSFMDDWAGHGKRTAVIPEGREDWNTDYYSELYANAEESKAAAYKIALDVQREGTILLKNNGVLPLAAGSTVTPFGARYKNRPVYGQVSSSGSAKWTVNPTTPEDGLKDTFTINNAAQDLIDGRRPASVASAAGTTSVGTNVDWATASNGIFEFPVSELSSAAAQVSGTALVFIGREGVEGSDKKNNGYVDGTPHYFALSQNEKDTIAFAKTNCSKVVVILQVPSSMQIPELMSGASEADAIVLFGHAGEKGYEVLGDILSGKVNPSGRTVAVWASDFTKDPTYQNFGAFTYSNQLTTSNTPNASGTQGYGRNYVEYDEDMYMGYRYYETAHDIKASGFTYGELDGKGAIKTAGAVEYPFGYGLSYTSFSQTIQSYSDSGDRIQMTVRVTNTGEKEGKEVVQLYYNPPYGQVDKDMKIEKPTKTMIAFSKTKLLGVGDHEDIAFDFAKEEMASYCYTRENPDGTKGCYVLTEGDYIISVQKNSHEIIDSKTWKNNATAWFDSLNPRQSEKLAQSALDDDGKSLNVPAKGADAKYQAATNLFQDSSDYMNRESKILTRSDWGNTFPEKEVSGTKSMTDETKNLFKSIALNFNVQTDERLGNVEGSLVYHAEGPVSGADNGLTLSDLRGKDYYDQAWDEWLDQIDYIDSAMIDQIVNVSCKANYATTPVTALGIPLAQHSDGANGLKVFKTDYGMSLSATYGLTPLWAGTFNTELMKALGDMLGQEAMKNNISGWYAPAINLHRTPFSGRNFEYYSEDPVLTGKIASAVVSGATGRGLYCYLKHFAMNDQETNRNNYISTWATEQTMREIYFRAYEIPFKEAMMTIKYTADENGNLASKTMRAATAVMATQSCIGQYYGHADYRLLTQLLRGEWGFKGTVTSDMYNMMDYYHQAYDFTFRAGCDTFLPGGTAPTYTDRTSATARHMMRRIIHNVGYTIANSNLMQGNPPGTVFIQNISPWKLYLLMPVDIGLSLAIIVAVAWIVLRTISEKKNPDLYARR